MTARVGPADPDQRTNARERAQIRPPRGRGMSCAKEPPGHAAEPLGRSKAPARGECHGSSFHGDGLGRRPPTTAVRVHHLRAQLHQHLRDVDPNRTRLETGTAQGRGVRKGIGLVVDAHTLEERIENGANRPWVDRSVGVPTGALVHRADIEARRAANTPQRLTTDAVSERSAATIVEQDDVDLLGTITRGYPRPGRGVGVHPLPGGGARQGLEVDIEVTPGGHDLLDADHRDQHLGQGQAHPAIALGLHHDQGSGVRDGEVGTRDGDLRTQELLPQVQPGRFGQTGGFIGQILGRGPPRCAQAGACCPTAIAATPAAHRAGRPLGPGGAAAPAPEQKATGSVFICGEWLGPGCARADRLPVAR